MSGTWHLKKGQCNLKYQKILEVKHTIFDKSGFLLFQLKNWLKAPWWPWQSPPKKVKFLKGVLTSKVQFLLVCHLMCWFVKLHLLTWSPYILCVIFVIFAFSVLKQTIKIQGYHLFEADGDFCFDGPPLPGSDPNSRLLGRLTSEVTSEGLASWRTELYDSRSTLKWFIQKMVGGVADALARDVFLVGGSST